MVVGGGVVRAEVTASVAGGPRVHVCDACTRPPTTAAGVVGLLVQVRLFHDNDLGAEEAHAVEPKSPRTVSAPSEQIASVPEGSGQALIFRCPQSRS